jgi:hypothetical protein
MPKSTSINTGLYIELTRYGILSHMINVTVDNVPPSATDWHFQLQSAVGGVLGVAM